jgi:hypothetical protein
MGFLDRLFGRTDPAPEAGRRSSARTEDELAVERYRYLLRTAPPETIEQVHAEAFGRLSPEQRRQVLDDLSSTLPDAERPRSDDPEDMARAATRAEYTRPGYLERTLGPRQSGGAGGGMGFGSMVGSSLLGTVAGYVVGSALVSTFMTPALADDGGSGAEGESGGADGPGADAGSNVDGSSSDAGGDVGGGDFGGGDFGGGGFGGDFGF